MSSELLITPFSLSLGNLRWFFLISFCHILYVRIYMFFFIFCLLFVKATMWKFVLLGLAFICLLIGFLLLGMGAMANKYDPQLNTHILIAPSLESIGSIGKYQHYSVFNWCKLCFMWCFFLFCLFFYIRDNTMN